MNKKECLEKAMETVCNDREETYGKPEDNFKLIANLWSAYKGAEFSAKDVAVMMALLKVARIATGKHKDDNFIDLAGYAACACEISNHESIIEIGKSFIEGAIEGVKWSKEQVHQAHMEGTKMELPTIEEFTNREWIDKIKEYEEESNE